jgi:hypothetical protein
MGARLLWSNVSSSSFVLENPDDASQSKRGNKIIARQSGSFRCRSRRLIEDDDEHEEESETSEFGSDLETNKWQPAQELGDPAPHATLGRGVKPGARCPSSGQPTQDLLQSGQTLARIFPWIRTRQAV